MPAEKSKIQAIFNEAIALDSHEDRVRYLDQTCVDDDQIRARVEALLNAHSEAGGFFGGKSPDGAATEIRNPTEAPGTVIGPYRLLEQIGEGGMGTVFMAQQTVPVQRMIALKVIKAGMDSQQVIARFEAERQALALMDHPSIAKVFDAGTTEAGRPYFVMELVKGVPITTYCDENRLPPKARLELFSQVCHAVQHAHHKGVIHRDIKPTNVLVTLYDDKPVPKVIDFGVAKATGGRLTERTMFTGFGQVVGTLEYMSPEQARFNALDIDTRGDVYSLGVLLYELLTGTTPFDKRRLREAAFDEMLRMIREEEPPRPSIRLSTAEARASIAVNRGMEPNKLTGLVRGELDWIVMKALEKDRSRRYETANGLAMDVQRYLHDEHVLACPPSASYRLRKIIHRNKVAIVTGSVIAAALVLGTAVSTWQALRATQAEVVAQKHLEAEQDARRKAHEAGEQFFTRVSENRLLDEPGLQPLRKDLLEAAVTYYERLADRGSDDPKGQADLTVSSLRLSQIYYQTGFYERHISALEKAIGLVEKLLREHPDASDLHLRIAGFWHGGRNLGVQQPLSDTRSALRVYQTAAALWETLSERYPGVTGFQSDLSKFYDQQGWMQQYLKQDVEAFHTAKKVCEIREEIVRANPGIYEHVAELGHAYTMLARTLETSDPQASEALYRRAITLQTDAPSVATYQEFLGLHHAELGHFLARQKRADEAILALEQGIIVHQKLAARFPHASEYPATLAHWSHEVNQLRPDTGDAQQVLSPLPSALREQALALLKGLKVADAPAALYTAAFLQMQAGDACRAAREPQKAEQLYRTAIALFKALPPELADAKCRESLCLAYAYLGGLFASNSPADAEEAFRAAFELAETLASDFPDMPVYRSHLVHRYRDLAALYSRLGRAPEAEQAHLLALPVLEKLVAETSQASYFRWVLAATHRDLADLWAASHRLQEAEQAYHQSIDLLVALTLEQPDKPEYQFELGLGHHYLAEFLRTHGQLREAEKSHRQAVEIQERLVAEFPDHADYQSALGVRIHHLNMSLRDLGEPREALKLVNLAIERQHLALKLNPDGDYRNHLRWHYHDLALLLVKLGEHVESAQALENLLQLHLEEDWSQRFTAGQLAHCALLAESDARLSETQRTAVRASYTASARKCREDVIQRLRLTIAQTPDTALPQLAKTYLDLGFQLASNSQTTEAEQAYHDAITLCEKLVTEGQESPGNADSHRGLALVLNNAAWHLASSTATDVLSPEFKIQSAHKAVTLAQKAVELTPKASHAWNTLGVAQLRAQDWEHAIESLKKSEEIEPGTYLGFNGFFLSMAEWKLGRKDESHSWYDQAVEWMEKNKPQDEELKRFRAEAVELLGLKE